MNDSHNIINCLKILNYYNPNFKLEFESFMKYHSNNYDYENCINRFNLYFNHKIKRAIELSKFIDYGNIYLFYQALNEYEFYYLNSL